MSTATLTERDVEVRDNVTRQLDWEPEVDASGIGVSAHNGVVTLTGFIDTYAGKLAAERTAKKVRGVRGVANELEVRLKIGRTDVDIAADVVRALELRAAIPVTVQAVVHDGHVILTGRVGWLFQSDAAESLVHHIKGVRGVVNRIEVARGAVVRDVRHRIIQAMHRNADLDARHVDIHVNDDVVTLSGYVASWQQRETAERSAANAPGVTRVINEIVVTPRDDIR